MTDNSELPVSLAGRLMLRRIVKAIGDNSIVWTYEGEPEQLVSETIDFAKVRRMAIDDLDTSLSAPASRMAAALAGAVKTYNLPIPVGCASSRFHSDVISMLAVLEDGNLTFTIGFS